MNLYLARHGQAASSESGDSPQLTPKGKEDVTRVGQELAKRRLNIQQIWHSPKDRAKQTADIYAALLGIPQENLIENKELSMDGDVDQLYQDLLEAKMETILVVSHEPTLEELSSLLVAGSDHLPHIFFPTSGVAAFEQGPNWRWSWLLEPSVLK